MITAPSSACYTEGFSKHLNTHSHLKGALPKETHATIKVKQKLKVKRFRIKF